MKARHQVHRADLTISVRDAPLLNINPGGSRSTRINPLKVVITAKGDGAMWVEVSGTLLHGRGQRRSVRFNLASTRYRPMPGWVREIVDATLERHDI